MIHKTSIIDSNAKISKDASIGPYTVIGPNVEIGEETEIKSHVNITGNTRIGKNNIIYPFASIGNDPQDLKFQGEETKLEIGHNNKIREYVTINPGTRGGGGSSVNVATANNLLNQNYLTLSFLQFYFDFLHQKCFEPSRLVKLYLRNQEFYLQFF